MSAPALPGGSRSRTGSSSIRPSAGRTSGWSICWPAARHALVRSLEGAEDDAAAGRADDGRPGPEPADVVVAVAASGTTAFTRAAQAAAGAAGALTVAHGQQPDRTAAGRGRDPGPAAHRPRVPRRLDPHDRRHRAEDRAEPVLDPADDRARPGLPGPDGQRRPGQRQARRPQPAHRPGDHRLRRATRPPRPGSAPARTSSWPCCCSMASTRDDRCRPAARRRAATCAAPAPTTARRR